MRRWEIFLKSGHTRAEAVSCAALAGGYGNRKSQRATAGAFGGSAMTYLMRTLSVICLVSAGLALPTLALAHPVTPSAETKAAPLTGAAAEAARVVDAFHAALKAGETGKAASLMAPGVLVFEAGGAETSKAAYGGASRGGRGV